MQRICKVEMAKQENLIEHEGIIQHISGDTVRVLIVQSAACAGCHAQGACMAADKTEKIIDAQATEPVRVGDSVTVYAQQKLGIKAVVLAFVVPFLLIFITLALTGLFTDKETVTGTAALAVLIPYYVVLSLFKDKLKKEFVFYARKNTLTHE